MWCSAAGGLKSLPVRVLLQTLALLSHLQLKVLSTTACTATTNACATLWAPTTFMQLATVPHHIDVTAVGTCVPMSPSYAVLCLNHPEYHAPLGRREPVCNGLFEMLLALLQVSQQGLVLIQGQPVVTCSSRRMSSFKS